MIDQESVIACILRNFILCPSSFVKRFRYHQPRQERPRPQTGRDQTAVTADEPQPGLLREVTFEHRRGVDEDLTQRLPPCPCPDERIDRVKLRLDDIVIVRSAGVAGDAALGDGGCAPFDTTFRPVRVRSRYRTRCCSCPPRRKRPLPRSYSARRGQTRLDRLVRRHGRPGKTSRRGNLLPTSRQRPRHARGGPAGTMPAISKPRVSAWARISCVRVTAVDPVAQARRVLSKKPWTAHLATAAPDYNTRPVTRPTQGAFEINVSHCEGDNPRQFRSGAGDCFSVPTPLHFRDGVRLRNNISRRSSAADTSAL